MEHTVVRNGTCIAGGSLWCGLFWYAPSGVALKKKIPVWEKDTEAPGPWDVSFGQGIKWVGQAPRGGWVATPPRLCAEKIWHKAKKKLDLKKAIKKKRAFAHIFFWNVGQKTYTKNLIFPGGKHRRNFLGLAPPLGLKGGLFLPPPGSDLLPPCRNQLT